MRSFCLLHRWSLYSKHQINSFPNVRQFSTFSTFKNFRNFRNFGNFADVRRGVHYSPFLKSDAKLGQKGGVGVAKEFYLTLEKSVGSQRGKDLDLIFSDKFDAYVTPDLPWKEKGKKSRPDDQQSTEQQLLQVGSLDQMIAEAREVQKDEFIKPDGLMTINTLAAQIRKEEHLRELIKIKAEGADGLLFVSGDDPRRKLLNKSVRRNTSWLLKEAYWQKTKGIIPGHLEFWATANPNLNKEPEINSIETKIQCGASVILTQPPLNWHRFEKWWKLIDKWDINRRVKIVVGLPMVASMDNFDFWAKLCKCEEVEDVRAVRIRLKEHAKWRGQETDIWNAYNRALIKEIKGLPNLGGFHVMPLTRAAKSMTYGMLRDGLLYAPED